MTTEKKENHKTLIVRITEILPIQDAEKVEIVKFGLPYQCVSQKGTFKVGDLAVYVQPDSVVPVTEPFRFIWEPYVTAVDTLIHAGGTTEPVPWAPEKRRRITVKRLRGEWSEGLLLPVADFPELYETVDVATNQVIVFYTEGMDVSDALGITHYNPTDDAGDEGDKPRRKSKTFKRPKSIKGWFLYLLNKLDRLRNGRFHEGTTGEGLDYPKYDVDALKSLSRSPFLPEDRVVITEKIHGSSARFVFLDGKMYTGSRNLWVSDLSTGYPRKALKANPAIETWCRAHEGFALYGEVTPTQKGFDYGSKDYQFFLFDIRSPEGEWLGFEDPLYLELAQSNQIQPVPTLYIGGYDPTFVKVLVDGNSSVYGAKHIREGIVIKTTQEREVRRGQRAQFKVVSNKFLEKDSK